MASEFAGRSAPLSPDGFAEATERLRVTAAAVWAILRVETTGCGFLPDRRPKILFERHLFHQATGGRFSQSHPGISHPTAGGYGPGEVPSTTGWPRRSRSSGGRRFAPRRGGWARCSGSTSGPRASRTSRRWSRPCATRRTCSSRRWPASSVPIASTRCCAPRTGRTSPCPSPTPRPTVAPMRWTRSPSSTMCPTVSRGGKAGGPDGLSAGGSSSPPRPPAPRGWRGAAPGGGRRSWPRACHR
jgi:hypothetical protein